MKYPIGIVLVHGLQGSPRQFDFLTDSLPDSVFFRSVLLPGHGADIKDYRRATAEQWLDAVKKACAEAAQACERVIFVGHSMGCLTGLLIQEKLKLFSGMILICCPFYVRPTWRYLRNSYYTTFSKRKTDDPFITAARRANSVSARHAAEYLFCAHPVSELFRLIHVVRERKPKPPKETVFCFTEFDEIVGERSALYAQKELGAETVLLKGCGHNYFAPPAQKQLVDMTESMITEDKKKG